jgi:restriction system protein
MREECKMARRNTTKYAGDAYEKHVARKMRRRGFFFVKVSGKSGDFGADVMARDLLLRKVVVQCKCYSGSVGVEAVQEIHAAKTFYNARRAIVATNSKFTRAARKLAHKLNVELWERY